jgi:hypothetical protein
MLDSQVSICRLLFRFSELIALDPAVGYPAFSQARDKNL